MPIRCTSTMLRIIDLAVAWPTPTGPPEAFHARVDLPDDPADLPDLVDALLDPVLRHRIDRVVLIGPSVNPRERSVAAQAGRFLQDLALTSPKVIALGLKSYLEAGPVWFVRNLRPTVLDQRGLLGAVTEFARQFDEDLDIRLDLPLRFKAAA